MHPTRPPPPDPDEGRRWLEPDRRCHEAQVRAAQQAGQWFAAALHLQRLLLDRPLDSDLHAQRASVLVRLGQPGAAAQHWLQAVLLARRDVAAPLDPEASVRGEEAARAGDWPRAALEFHLAASQPGMHLHAWTSLLHAQLAAGQEDAFRQTCTALLDRLGPNPDRKTAFSVLFACRLGPSAAKDAARLVPLAETLVTTKRDASSLNRLGETLYRAGRFGDAAKALQEALQAHGKGGYVDSWLFLAMAQQWLGRGAEARQGLTRVERWHEKAPRATWTWEQRARWEILLREARSLILQMPPAP